MSFAQIVRCLHFWDHFSGRSSLSHALSVLKHISSLSPFLFFFPAFLPLLFRLLFSLTLLRFLFSLVSLPSFPFLVVLFHLFFFLSLFFVVFFSFLFLKIVLLFYCFLSFFNKFFFNFLSLCLFILFSSVCFVSSPSFVFPPPCLVPDPHSRTLHKAALPFFSFHTTTQDRNSAFPLVQSCQK